MSGLLIDVTCNQLWSNEIKEWCVVHVSWFHKSLV